MRVPAPISEAELFERARRLAGLTLAGVAESLDVPVPTDPVRGKGWAGELIEQALGAEGTSAPEPDFPHLGIELKTVPIQHHGRAKESTHVCVVPLDGALGLTWENSLVRRKLARVLWVPLLSATGMDLGRRVVCPPLLWSPSAEEEARLRADWEELMEFVSLGRVHELTAHHGDCLQIRPKAANAKAVTQTSNPRGELTPTNPRGFYLRPSFTSDLLASNFILPSNA